MATLVTAEPGTTERPPHRTPSRRHAALVVGLAVLVAGVWATWSVTIDDAFITFRYSAHLAAGDGPVWNVGQDPVEGFTNFAWMAWHALFALAGADLPTVAKVTSALLAVAIVVQLWRSTTTWAGTVAALGCYLLFLPTFVHVTAGLETTAVAAVLLRLVVLGLRVLRGEPVRPWEPPLLLLLAGMLRPEGALAALPVVLTWFWRRRGGRPEQAWAASAVVAGAVYFWWRWSYFGQLLPNTFYVKFGNLSSGQTWVVATVVALLPLLALAVGLLRMRGPGLLVVATVLLTYLPYAVSGPSMDYVHRFAFHAFPVLCLAAGLVLGGLADRGRTVRRLAAGVAAVTVGWVAVAGVTASDLPTVLNYGVDLDRAHVAIGKGLAASTLPADRRTLAVSDAGAMPYFSGWTATDYIGLNDEAIAHGAAPDDVVGRADPTVLVVTSETPLPPPRAYGLDIARATAGKMQVAAVPMRDGYYQLVFVKTELVSDVGPALAASVARAYRAHPEGFEITFGRWLDRTLPGT